MFFIDVPSVSVYSLVTGQLYVGCRKLAHTVAKLVINEGEIPINISCDMNKTRGESEQHVVWI